MKKILKYIKQEGKYLYHPTQKDLFGMTVTAMMIAISAAAIVSLDIHATETVIKMLFF